MQVPYQNNHWISMISISYQYQYHQYQIVWITSEFESPGRHFLCALHLQAPEPGDSLRLVPPSCAILCVCPACFMYSNGKKPRRQDLIRLKQSHSRENMENQEMICAMCRKMQKAHESTSSQLFLSHTSGPPHTATNAAPGRY
jgi:hypothetical protein